MVEYSQHYGSKQTKLRELGLRGCNLFGSLRLLSGIMGLQNLCRLTLSGCTNAQSFVADIGPCADLQNLSLEHLAILDPYPISGTRPPYLEKGMERLLGSSRLRSLHLTWQEQPGTSPEREPKHMSNDAILASLSVVRCVSTLFDNERRCMRRWRTSHSALHALSVRVSESVVKDFDNLEDLMRAAFKNFMVRTSDDCIVETLLRL